MALKGMNVLVVGGSSGIGLAVARAVLERGARAILVGRSREKLASARAALGGANAPVDEHAADVTREADVAAMFERAGAIDHIVVTAVIAGYGPIAAMEERTARSVIDVKLVAALLIAKHAPSRLRAGGSITFTSGIAKDRPMPGGAVVAAVNGALEALARALALEMAPTRVNTVSPGWVETPVWDALMGERKTAAWEQMARRLPVGRIALPADVATAYTFLMESSFATGTTVHVDGGHALV